MPRKKKVTPKRTRVGVIQDKSGSMYNRRAATIEGYNEYIQTLKSESEGEVLLTLTQFDTRVTTVFEAQPLADVKLFKPSDYIPGGMTALHDAIGRTIRSTESAIKKNDRVTIVVMTDGLENSSHEWSLQDISALLEEKRKDGWEFIFLGAGADSWVAGQNLGFKKSQVINYGARDPHDHKAAVMDVAFATVNTTKGRSAESYLRSSPVKVALEVKAMQEANPTSTTKPRTRARRTTKAK